MIKKLVVSVNWFINQPFQPNTSITTQAHIVALYLNSTNEPGEDYTRYYASDLNPIDSHSYTSPELTLKNK